MKQWQAILVGIWILVAGYFGVWGATTVADEGDSVIYHQPIARSLLEGGFGEREYMMKLSPFAYYTGGAELLLVPMLKWNMPMNLFNVAGWGCLVLLLRVLAGRRGIKKELAWIYATSLTLIPSMLRLLPTQTVDIWLAVWWTWILIMLTRIRNESGWWIQLGIAVGMLVGTKYTGIVYAGLLMLGWGKELVKTGKLEILGALVIAEVVGGWWYVRNYLLTGNPVYPLNMGMGEFVPGAQLPIVWKTLWYTPETGKILLSAWGSEFLGWGIAPLIWFWKRNKWTWIGMVCLIMFLGLPGGEGTLLSNLRYMFPGLIVLGVEGFKYLQEKGKSEWLGAAAAMNGVMVMPQLLYRPKLMLMLGVGWGIYQWKKIGKRV